MWVLIAATAIVSGVCGLIAAQWAKGYEAISIIAVSFVILFITAYADYMKDTKFVKLQELVKDENITVIRGKHNATHKVSVWSLVVGDVILLETGQRVPADCIIINSVDMKVDEEPEDDKVAHKPKAARDPQGEPGADPFLRSDSLVVRGTCKAVVAAVGANSSRGKYATSIAD